MVGYDFKRKDLVARFSKWKPLIPWDVPEGGAVFRGLAEVKAQLFKGLLKGVFGRHAC
jgi:hypothetical protein